MNELEQYAGYDSLNTIVSDTDVFNMVFKAYCNDDLLNVLHLINTVLKMNPLYHPQNSHQL